MIPTSLQWGPGLFSVSTSLSLSLISVDRSFSCCTPQAPAAISFSLHANPSGLFSFPPPLLFSSHLISSPCFQSFRSSFKPGPRGQEFGLVFSDQSVGFVVVTACSGAPSAVLHCSPTRLMSTHSHAFYLFWRKALKILLWSLQLCLLNCVHINIIIYR